MMALLSKWRKQIDQPLAQAPIAGFLVDFHDKARYLFILIFVL
jgi:hypothetical protein